MARNLGLRLGARLRARREAMDWSQAQLAEAAGVTPNYVGVVERGEKLPTLETLDTFARALGATLGALVSEEEPDHWADEAGALARAVPAPYRRLVLAVLKAAATEGRNAAPRRASSARRSSRSRHRMT